jgi:mannosyltransferase OCH1-like enzyme
MFIIIICVIITVILLTYKDYHLLLFTSTIPRVSMSSKTPKYTLFQTGESRGVNRKMFNDCHRRWLELNNNLRIEWFDDRDRQTYMMVQPSRVYEAYQRVRSRAHKADLFRACILFDRGGLFADTHIVPYLSIDEMLHGCMQTSRHSFVSAQDDKKKGSGIHTGFMFVTKGHPFMKVYIEHIVDNIESGKYTSSALGITGSVCLLRAINEVTGRSPSSLFAEGWNSSRDLTFYLFRNEHGICQYIKKGETPIVTNQYCLASSLLDRMRSPSYQSMWDNCEVFKTR